MSSQKKTKKSSDFTEEEKAAMKERAKELKKETHRSAKKEKQREEGESDIMEKLAEMSETDRTMATRLHELLMETAPELMPRTWYGMPAYANEDGKVVCFFQAGEKFKTRYSSFGFSDSANLDEGDMWPVSYALKKLTPAVEARVVDLVKEALS
ncbi:MAG TPA: hypothetical protein VJ965_02210 [Anaerolineales bacterium]|nr:hypothetical protein [Anaerolineales bacterium]